jgi:hypothetical protein
MTFPPFGTSARIDPGITLIQADPRLHMLEGIVSVELERLELDVENWRMFDEERFLAQNLPGYADYQRRVPHRLIP